MDEEKSFILHQICRQIELSETAKEQVKNHYEAIAKLLSNSDKLTGNVDVKPQGSFNLGTAIRPLNGEEDDYDIDLTVIVSGDEDPKHLKHSVGEALCDNKVYRERLQPEKKRAWTLEYAGSHVDVVPAGDTTDADMLITNKISQGNYEFRESSPFTFKNWFELRGRNIYQKLPVENRSAVFGKIEHPQDYKEYTILQEVVQLLKHHRNQMFDGKDSELKPISMIITVLVAEAYGGQDDLADALTTVAVTLRDQISYDENGTPHIYNPVNHDEDFADKWREHPERQEAFFAWLNEVEKLFGKIYEQTRQEFSDSLTQSYGEKRVIRAFDELGEKQKIMQSEAAVSLGTSGVFEEGNVFAKKHNFFGGDK